MINNKIEKISNEIKDIVVEEKDFEDFLAKYVTEDAVKNISVDNVAIEDNAFVYVGESLGDSLDVVILNYCFINAYYSAVYDPNDLQVPDCFAIALSEKDLKPLDVSQDKQYANCFHCPKNEFGSAITGKGKACRNRQKIAFIASVDVEKKFEDITVFYLKIAPTSLKNVANYFAKLLKIIKLPIFAVQTQISLEKPAKAGHSILNLKMLKVIEGRENFSTLIKLREKATENLLSFTEFQQDSETLPELK
jgi:hypothetical protein